MDGVDYTFTETSLTPEWPAVEDADGYVVALFRDEVELDRADVTGTSATFEGLEDGTRYTLSFYAYNAQGRGPETTGYDATTAYKIPSPPSNIRQDGEMIIGISTLWDAPEKTNQLHIQLFYGDQVLYDEYAPGSQTARVFPVPMASTNYLLRIRAGNPAGWSEWAEAVVYTEKYPLIDSRLGVMATTYQESYLYPDTWSGGSGKQSEGVVESSQVAPRPGEGSFSLMTVPSSTCQVSLTSAISNVRRFQVRKEASAEDFAGLMVMSSMVSGVTTRSLLRYAEALELPASIQLNNSVSNVYRVRLRYRASVSEPAASLSLTNSISGVTKEIV